jgi:heme/copper-type cytochrome/quinol oxidase subunit 4
MQGDDLQPRGGMESRQQVMRYVAALEAELAGCDPALRHDAVIDAETHLRSAIGGGVPAERAIADFGTPQEVARAYLEQNSEMYGWRSGEHAQSQHVAAAAAAGAPGGHAAVPLPAESVAPQAAPKRTIASRIPILGIWVDPRAWGALVYFGAVGFALSIAYFVWSVTIGSLVVGLAPLVIGIPLLVLLLGSARALCLFEGKVVETLLGVRMPRRVQPVEGADSVGFWQRILCWLRDVRSWLSLAYLLGNFFVSVGTFVLTITLCAISVSLLASGAASLAGVSPILLGDGAEQVTVHLLWWRLEPDASGAVHIPRAAAIPMIAVGLALATATLWLMRGLGWIYAHVVQAIQVARPQAAGRRTLSNSYGTHP